MLKTYYNGVQIKRMVSGSQTQEVACELDSESSKEGGHGKKPEI